MKKLIFTFLTIFMGANMVKAQYSAGQWLQPAMNDLKKEYASKLDDKNLKRLETGLLQTSSLWQKEDGDEEEYKNFIRTNFYSDQNKLDALFERFERILEQTDGHMAEISRQMKIQTDLDKGEILPMDEIFSGYDPAAHLADDLFGNKIAFVALLNFPVTSLDTQVKEGENWNRRQWAETRLAQRFSKRIPSSVNLAVAKAQAETDQYISGYNIWMHHLLNEKGERLFAPKLRLLSHWNLRDELKADYTEGAKALPKQRMIQQVMERIVTQTIPAGVIDNPNVDWNPYTNEVKPAAVKDSEKPSVKDELTGKYEPDARYENLLKAFRASRLADPYSPLSPTHIARKFNDEPQLSEERVTEILKQVLSSPLSLKVGALVEKRLGRPIEPFDIWYDGFKARNKYTEAELDKIVSEKYSTADAYKKDIPSLLVKLGFTKEKAEIIAANIAVDPARGSGHAMGALMRDAKARLRTRVEKSGMNYKGYNIAVHEMGHNVEQTFSMNFIDHTLLQGVPNTAFTEAFAFVFQSRDLQLLGLSQPDENSKTLETINDYWMTYEIAGVALVDIAVWHWMYDHPDANAAQLKEATIGIAKDIWNQYYAPVFHKKDVVLLGIYSHMIDAFLYLPDYPIGHLISFQIEEQIEKAGNLGSEFERMATYGNVAPDLWMKHATGKPVGADALLNATEKALKDL